MNRIILQEGTGNPHFIGCWNLESAQVCERLIDFFDNNADKHTQGKMAGGFNPDSKRSTDLSIRPRDLDSQDHAPVREYIECLYACYADYLEQWEFLKQQSPRVEISSFNIQRYQPGGHFQKVHSERMTISTAHRFLAWMTYLNDVDDGGSTEFVHQGIRVQPQQGKTLIWPAEWTHAHAGNVVNSGNKYIITGWMHFIQAN